LVRAESTSYPSGNGGEWYVWCCRTGRGDVKNAEKLAAQYFTMPQPDAGDITYMRLGMYKVMQGDLQAARAEFQKVLAIKRGFTYTCLVAEISKELNDKQAAAEVITAMEKELENPTIERKPSVLSAGTLMLDLVKNGNPTPERVAAVEQSLVKLPADDRVSAVGWCYFIGAELQAAGNKKEAEKYLRRALVDPDRDQILAGLAGLKLAKLNGKSRPDSDPLEAKDLWPPDQPK
jgi:tetratricopeptide (TPR) repeat protein